MIFRPLSPAPIILLSLYTVLIRLCPCRRRASSRKYILYIYIYMDHSSSLLYRSFVPPYILHIRGKLRATLWGETKRSFFSLLNSCGLCSRITRALEYIYIAILLVIFSSRRDARSVSIYIILFNRIYIGLSLDARARFIFGYRRAGCFRRLTVSCSPFPTLPILHFLIVISV